MVDQDYVQLTYWTMGYMGTVYTASIFPAPAMLLFIWIGIIYNALFIESTPAEAFDLLVWSTLSTFIGVITGMSVILAGQYNALIETSLRSRDSFRKTGRRMAPEFTLLALASILIVFGYHCLTGKFSDGITPLFNSDVELVLGIILLGIGVIMTLIILIWALVSKRDRFNKAMNIKYFLSLAIGCVVAPVTYDYIHRSPVSNFLQLITLLVIIVYWWLMYMHFGRVLFAKESKRINIRISTYMYDGIDRNSTAIMSVDRFGTWEKAKRFALISGVIQLVVYIAGWVADIASGVLVWPVVLAIAGASVLSFLVMMALTLNNSKKMRRRWKENDSESTSSMIGTLLNMDDSLSE